MDLSSEPSRDEDRIMERQLYRAGQTPAAPKPSAARPGSSSSLPQSKSLSVKKDEAIPLIQRRLVRTALCAAWLLFLTGASYCVFLPDPVDEAGKQLKELWGDRNLTREQRKEKAEQILGNLSDRQRYNLLSPAEMRVKAHDEHAAFFKLSRSEQEAQLKQEILDFQKQMEEARANGGRWPGGGPKGGGFFRMRGPDSLPPETQEQMGVKWGMKREMMDKMGISFGRGRGGPGGPGGGRGGPGGPGGGRGGPGGGRGGRGGPPQ